MNNRLMKPFLLLGLFILIVGLACGAGTTVAPTAVPPTEIPPTAVPPTEVPTEIPPTEVPPTEVPTEIPPTEVPPTEVPTEVPPTEPPLPSPTPLPLPTEAPTDVPAASAPDFYKEEFDGSSSSFYPDEYYYRILNGPDEIDEDVYLQNDKLVFEIDTKDTWIYINYFPWLYKDVRIGVEAENLGKNSQSISLICRYEEGRGWIEFNIAGDGTYNILAYNELEGSGYNLLFNGGSTAIKIGKATNTYIAECIGDEISLFANGVEVKTMTVPNAYRFLDEGEVGFSVSSFDSLPVLVELEWFWIEAP